jgi:hypothetical protein
MLFAAKAVELDAVAIDNDGLARIRKVDSAADMGNASQ